MAGYDGTTTAGEAEAGEGAEAAFLEVVVVTVPPPPPVVGAVVVASDDPVGSGLTGGGPVERVAATRASTMGR